MTKLEEIINKIPQLGSFLSSAQGFDVIRTIAKEYAEFCCEEQKKICAEKAEMCDEIGNTAATLYKYDQYNREREWIVSKDSILNAKLKVD